MKNFKRFLSMALAVLMVAALAVTAFAEGEDGAEVTVEDSVTEGGETPVTPAEPTPSRDMMEGTLTETGSITISNAQPAETYKIYQILYLESYETDSMKYDPVLEDYVGGTFSYKANSNWEKFVNSAGISGVYLSTDDKGYVTWCKKGYTGPDVVNFSQLALKWAIDNKIAPVEENTVNGEAGSNTAGVELKFENLKLGYYLIDTSLGALCTLNTTTPNISVKEKNTVPSVDKKVKEGNAWGETNDAKIGDTVYFRSIINFKSGVSHLVYHDTITDGLTMNYPSVEIILDEESTKAKISTLTKDTHYKVVTDEQGEYDGDATKKCSFHIEFLPTFYEEMLKSTGNHTLTITYNAILNDKAAIKNGTSANTNTAKLSYGDKNHYTPEYKTTTKTWEVPFYKYAVDGSTTKGLSDTHFILSNENGITDFSNRPIAGEIKLILVNDGIKDVNDRTKDEQAVYRVATDAEITDNSVTKVDEIITNNSGLFKIQGLDSKTYYLYETQSKSGYNKLEGPVTIVIESDGKYKKNEKDTPSDTAPIGIINNSGTVMPSTGGIGTTIFYVVGSVLLVGAGVLLVTKKRMSESK